jgi:hypothetical protein
MPTDREIEESTRVRQFTPPDTSGTPTPSLKDFVNYINSLQSNVPSVDSDTALAPTPTTSFSTNKQPVESKATYFESSDKEGNPITVVSVDSQLKSIDQFADAIYNHRTGKATPGFLIMRGGAQEHPIRLGYEDANRFVQNAIPQIGRTAGENNPLALMLNLAAKARGIPQSASDTVTRVSGDVGETIGRVGAEQIDSLPKLGMQAGLLSAAPFLAPVEGAGLIKPLAQTMGNALKTGLTGFAGTEAMRLAGGEDLTPEQGIQDFGIAAAQGGAQGLFSHFIARFLNKGIGEKVAKEMVDSFTSRYPAIGFQDNIPDIITSSPEKLSRATAMMGKALRNSMAEDTETLLTSVKQTLPGAIPRAESVSFQNTLRKGLRNVIKAQNEQLDNVGSPTLFEESGDKVQAAITELGDTIRGFEGFGKNVKMTPAALRAELILKEFQEQTRKYDQGALVLHYMKEAGGAEGLNFMKLAQLIRGEYQKTSGSHLEDIGMILGQGRQLTSMPLPKEEHIPSKGDGYAKAAVDFIKGMVPGFDRFSSFMKTRSPQQTPWPTRQPSRVIQPVINIGAQEAGQAAIRSFLEKKEQ